MDLDKYIMYNDVYPLLCYLEEYFQCPKDLVCHLFIHLLQPFDVNNFFTVSIVVPFPKYHLFRFTWYIVFLAWLLTNKKTRRHLTSEDMQMESKHMKKHSTPCINREM